MNTILGVRLANLRSADPKTSGAAFDALLPRAFGVCLGVPVLLIGVGAVLATQTVGLSSIIPGALGYLSLPFGAAAFFWLAIFGPTELPRRKS